MKYELDLFGVIVPSLLLWCVVAYWLARCGGKVRAADSPARSGAPRCSPSHSTSACLPASSSSPGTSCHESRSRLAAPLLAHRTHGPARALGRLSAVGFLP